MEVLELLLDKGANPHDVFVSDLFDKTTSLFIDTEKWVKDVDGEDEQRPAFTRRPSSEGLTSPRPVAQLPGVRAATGGHTVSRQSSGVPSLGKRASTASTMQRGGTGRRVSILGTSGRLPPSKEETDERTKERIAKALATPDTRAEAEREESSTPWADKQKKLMERYVT